MKEIRENKILLIISLLILAVEVDFSLIYSGETIRQGLIILLLVITSFNLRIEKIKLNKVGLTEFFFIFYLMFTFLSMLWSFSVSETFVSFVGIFIIYLVTKNISIKYDYHLFLKNLVIALFILVVFSWLLYFLGFKEYTLNKEEFFRFKGVFLHTQRLSLILGVAIIILFVKNDLFLNKKLRKIIIFIFLGTLILTKARAFITFTLLIFLYSNRNILKEYFLFIFFGLALSITLFIENIKHLFFDFYQRGDGELVELTGRTLVWQKLFPLIMEKPLSGYGFGAFKLRPINLSGYIPDHAHNLWLHQMYETGIIGCLLFSIFIIFSIKNSFDLNKKVGTSLVLYLAIFTILSGMTGLPLGANPTPLYFIFLICTWQEKKILNNHFNEINFKINQSRLEKQSL